MRAVTAFLAMCLLGFVVAPGQAHASNKWDTGATAGALGVPLAAGIISLVKDDWDGAWQLGFTYVATMGVTEGLKYTVDETRPDGGKHSFPSGHAASAFAGAAYLQRRYGWQYGVPAYAIGALVGYARVHNDKHYWHDILASAVIGSVAGFFITKPYNSPIHTSLLADPATKTYGIQASMRF